MFISKKFYFTLYNITFCIFKIFFTITYINCNYNEEQIILYKLHECLSDVYHINNDDINCDLKILDFHNNYEIYPILSQLLVKPYFKFFKINLDKKCPFWPDNKLCSSQYCFIKACDKDSIPAALRDTENNYNEFSDNHNKTINGVSNCSYINTTSNDTQLLNSVDLTISHSDQEAFENWHQHDSTSQNFCELDDSTSKDCKYVDLLLNPEQYTAFSGYPAHKIWKAIYEENCFNNYKKTKRKGYGISQNNMKDLCLEKRAFYMALSGLHSSITIHLCSRFYFSDGSFEHNPMEFTKRFDLNLTRGEGSRRLRNLYFTYLLEMRALAKIAQNLQHENYFTGNAVDDDMVNQTMKKLLRAIKAFPCHFDEHTMFQGNKSESLQLKEDIRSHFLNISRIMDCVSCDKCRLWGKLQTQGLGTAFKVLFDSKFSNPKHKKNMRLKRIEIVALLNAFGSYRRRYYSRTY
ncbi:ERO1-like protein alpha isoform X2 [Gordionus sp. m RMFG-2023]|uniref:ERO1-like protein alpha isoform X2 n=1 Tax=Gordionus sp. m RMFG-2023 TaxID=3053472 RepID=UPI0031FCBB19